MRIDCEGTSGAVGAAELNLATVYRTVAEEIPYGTWVCDADGEIVYLSASFLDLVGMTLEECRQFGWLSRLPPDRVERTLADWRHCVAAGSQWDYEHLIRDRNDDYRVVLSRGLPIRTPTGEVLGWAGLNLDVTARKRTEAELANLVGELQRVAAADTAPGPTSFGSVAMAACETAQAYFGCDSVSLWRRTDDVAALVARVPRDGVRVPDASPTPLPHLWAELAALRPVLIGEGGREPDPDERDYLARLRVHAQLRLPISLGTTADAFFALEWSRPGQALPTRTLAVAEDFATRAALVLADAWRREERRQRALEINDNVIQALVQAKGAVEHAMPTELTGALDTALDAARQVIGHLLTAEGGIALEPGQLVRPGTGSGAVAAADPGTGRVRVVLVDDQPGYRALLRHTLRPERRFVVVGEASDGAEAVSLASSVQLDAIVVDLAMPTMDGLEAIRLIRERAPRVKILALSGFAAEHLRATALEQGADAYLEKGGPIDEVVRTLATMVLPAEA